MPIFFVPVEGQIILDGGATTVYNAALFTSIYSAPILVDVDGSGNYSTTIQSSGANGFYLIANMVEALIWKGNSGWDLGERIFGGSGYWEVTTSGNTDSVEPSWDPLDSPITNGTVVWTYLGPAPNPVMAPTAYIPDLPSADPDNISSFWFTPNADGNWRDASDDDAGSIDANVSNGSTEWTDYGRPFDPTSTVSVIAATSNMEVYLYDGLPDVDFTFDLWIYVPSGAITYSSNIPIYSFQQYNYNDYMYYSTGLFLYDDGTPGKLRLRRGNSGYSINTTSTSPIPTDEWILVSIEHVGDTDYIYINGVMEGSSANTLEPTREPGNESINIRFGYDLQGGNSIYVGDSPGENAIGFAQYRMANTSRYGGVDFTMPTAPFTP